ncbi:MAG: hypothetical protein JXN64_05525 [Spirochaetes bacterium]|nr:hypothetical protein [Spirochaetota bacterium]
MHKSKIIKNIKAIAGFACLLFLFFLNTLSANPFFGEEGKITPAPPPVASGGTGPFTDLQFEYRDKIAGLLRQIKSGDSGDLIIIFIAASFMYGLFHAMGPGHRKTVIFSLFLSRKARLPEPAAAGFLSAGIHAGVSIFIILLIWLVQKTIASLSGTDRVYIYMEGFTFLALVIIAVSFIAARALSLFAKKEQLPSDNKKAKLYSVIIVTSLVPCPGVTMVLLLSIYLDLIAAGIAGVIAMSLGMGIVISVSGYIAYAGRETLFARIKQNKTRLARIAAILEIASYSIILLFSAYMAWPFVYSLI